MTTTRPRPRREVVTGEPRTRPTRPAPPVPPVPLDPEAAGLIRRQLSVALRAAGALVLLIGTLPLVMAFVPGAATARIGGLGLAWLLLGVAAYPVMWLIGRWYIRQVERNEARLPMPGERP